MELSSLILLSLSAMVAGFVDAIVGGGGLIQIPALLGVLPQAPIATIFGTNKLASIFGTGGAAIRYSRKLALPWRILLPMAVAAFAMSYLGARTVASLPSDWLRPLILFLLVVVTVYTYRHKSLGENEAIGFSRKRNGVIAFLVGGGIGFYDGFFGPGTGSFLIFVLIRLFGFGFLHASAAAKIINASTNLAALAYFWPHRHLVIALGFYMGALNLLGSLAGASLAIRLGTGFVRQVFLIVSSILILKFAWEIFS